jgi:hypothetical protein
VPSATTSNVLLVFPKASQVDQGLLQRLCRPETIKGEQREKVCCFEVVLFILFFTLLDVFIYHDICYGLGGGGGVDYSISRHSSERWAFSSFSEGFFYEHMATLGATMSYAPWHS